MRDVTKLYEGVSTQVFTQFMRCHPFPDLERLMVDAVEDECYEGAAIIRDEITARKNGTRCGHDRFLDKDPQPDEQFEWA